MPISETAEKGSQIVIPSEARDLLFHRGCRPLAVFKGAGLLPTHRKTRTLPKA
jgi:hypothetical protein